MAKEKDPLQERFEEGLRILNEGKPADALPILKELAEGDPGNPWYRTYYGLCLGRLKHFTEAEKHCQAAIELLLYQPQFYINLGEVYFLGAQRREAHKMFSEALKWDKENTVARKFLQRMTPRSKPVVSFLPRDHPLNVSLGKIRKKLNEPL